MNQQEIEARKTVPSEFQPISMWGYFGYEILFSIPLVGFIVLLVFALGGAKNYNLRNFARSYFCVAILWFIIIAVVAIITVATGATIGAFDYFNF